MYHQFQAPVVYCRKGKVLLLYKVFTLQVGIIGLQTDLVYVQPDFRFQTLSDILEPVVRQVGSYRQRQHD